MHTNVNIERNSWRLPPDETVQVADPRSKSAEDLVYPGDGNNWRSIVLSLLVIGMVIAGIVTAIYMLGYVDELLYWSGRRMKLQEYLQGHLSPVRLPPTWLSARHFVFQADDGSLTLFDAENDTVTILVSNHTLRQLDVKGYECSQDLRYVLFRHNVKSVFRQSYVAHYTVYDVMNDHHIPVRLMDAPKAQQTRLQHASWLGKTTGLILIAENDIFVRTGPIETDHQVTFTGRPGLVYNGIPDWLYQEDILRSPQALWTSPDGTHLMYATFNDTEVRTLTYPWFGLSGDGSGSGSGSSLGSWASFPEARALRYPTPGSTNPSVNLWICDLANITNLNQWIVKPPNVLEGNDYYLTSAGWIGQGNNHVAAIWMNRAQNVSIISACLAPNWTCFETHAERAPEFSWLEVRPHPVFSLDGDSFLLLASIKEGATNHYTHIKHVTLSEHRMAVLSHGAYEVFSILAWDSLNHLVYYLASHEHKPGQSHLYVVHDPGFAGHDSKHTEPQCITCDLGVVLWSSRYLYANCSHFGAFISPGAAHYVLSCEGPGLPLAGAHSAGTHRLKRVLFNTRPYGGPVLRQLALPTQRSFEVPLSQGSRAQVQLLLPPSWREELRDAAFPVLVEVNGRPGSQAVSERFRIDWGTYMSSRNDLVYIRLDVRGSKGQTSPGLYRHIGGLEVQDQITVLRYLLDSLTYLDETRVGVWGWGYGGYVTSMVLGSQQRVFKCGVAVSPIADWLYYNSAFTERILGFPNDNFKAYVEADATQRARYVPSHSLYLVHGLADLTTPYQHGVALARALAEAGVLFRYQTYADEGHALAGVLEHVYRSMEDYLKECLSLDDQEQA